MNSYTRSDSSIETNNSTQTNLISFMKVRCYIKRALTLEFLHSCLFRGAILSMYKIPKADDMMGTLVRNQDIDSITMCTYRCNMDIAGTVLCQDCVYYTVRALLHMCP